MTDSIDPAFSALADPLEAALMPFDIGRIEDVRRSRRAVMRRLKGRQPGATISRHPAESVFVPKDAGHGRVLYAHGGGWVLGDSHTHSAIMSDLAATSGLTVVGPDYPLAPEHPWPAALNALEDRAIKLADSGPLILSGDSAGANLALALAARLRDRGLRAAGTVLFYGCYRRDFDTKSARAFGDGRYGLSTQDMRVYWNLYTGDADGRPDADLTSLELSGLPPAFIGDAALDVLVDDGEWLADGLTSAGTSVERRVVPRVPHGFLHQTGQYDPAFELIAAAGAFAARLTAPPRPSW